MHIDLLANHREIIATLAKLYFDEWGHLLPELTAQDFGSWVAASANTDRIPLAIVAFEGQEFVGAATLQVHDLETRKDLSPWLVGVYVKEQWRRRGIGTQLIHAIEAKAAELRVPRLYLYTFKAEALYARLDWQVAERTTYQGRPITIMEKVICTGS